jgi:hypothetical protein
MGAGLVGTSGFTSIPITALDPSLVRRLRRFPRFRVRAPKATGNTIAESPRGGVDEEGHHVALAEAELLAEFA